MGRRVALIWHASMAVAALALYFFFVLPRWPEMMGVTTPALGLILRIVCGVFIGVAALPVVFTQMRTSKPEFSTPQLALTLRLWSVLLQVVAGVLIVGTAVSEIWVDLDRFGQILFGIYGAAAALAVLGFFAFYLSLVAELPPPPPKPITEKKEKKKFSLRRRSKASEDETDEDETDEDETDKDDDITDETEANEAVTVVPEADDADAEPEPEPEPSDEIKELAGAGLRNRRPSGKSGNHRRGRVRR
ncbi:MAG: hypothetical protein ACSLE6_01960 [Mycobacterium sp.]